MAYDFPSTPSIGQVANGYVWDGEKWLSSGSSGPVLATKKNYIINGAMQVSQENGATAGTATAYYPADMFVTSVVGTTGTFSLAQVASRSPAGSPNRIRFTVTAADAAVAAGDVATLYTRVEGQRMADLLFGLSTAKTVTIRFGVKAPAGTYCVVIANGAVNRNYTAEYVISASEANTDVVKSVTFIGDLTGTWAVDNNMGMQISWSMMCGSTYQQAAGVWGAGNFYGSSNQFNLFGTNGNIFELFDVSLTEGPVAPPFVVPDYPSELAACQRYYYRINSATSLTHVAVLHNYATTSVHGRVADFPTTMRASPTITCSAPGHFAPYIGSTTGAVFTSVSGTSSTTGLHLDLSGSSGLTVNGANELVFNTSSGWIAANARL